MYAFAILGSAPDISLEEITTVTGQTPLFVQGSVAVFEHLENLQALQDRLGGTVKLGVVHADMPRVTKDDLTAYLATLVEPKDEKVRLGISIYNGGDQETTRSLEQMSHALGISLKKAVQKEHGNARFVTSKDATLSSAAILKNQLLERGHEFVLIPSSKTVFIGETVAVQNIDDWSFRDMARPWRNAKRGMLPPKLARIMVNLTGINPEGSVLLDPFCGSGTVLMEAGILGFDLIGSDISEDAVLDTERNLDWIRAKRPIAETELHTSKASNVAPLIGDARVDAIAAEPFLGEPRQGTESREYLQRMKGELEALYTESFKGLKPSLKPGCKIVIANPVHLLKGEAYEPDTTTILKQLGYTEEPFSTDLVYKRGDQFVARHLLRFSI